MRFSLASAAVVALLFVGYSSTNGYAADTPPGDQTITANVQGPMCGGCIAKLNKKAKAVKGLTKLEVASKDFDAKTATVKIVLAKGAKAEDVLAELGKTTNFKFAAVE
ncbi:MAG: heavy metal-associated domain-containing protein [Planctomycetota bacterium]|nr:heavy metal-associated domain-containing protein [Planctomycetota bacterium]MDA1142078.1 heavy metal-associated domain-containing protein [Planctomycetota bacterium]